MFLVNNYGYESLLKVHSFIQVFSLVFVFSQPIVSHIVVKIAEVTENSRGWRGEGGGQIFCQGRGSRGILHHVKGIILL